VAEVASRVRRLPFTVSSTRGNTNLLANLYVNPSIGGFFNKQYTYLDTFLQTRDVRDLVVVSAGSGLSGARSAIEHTLFALPSGSIPPNINLYYGVRDLAKLAYRKVMRQWAETNNVRVTLLVSDLDSLAKEKDEVISAAARRGKHLATLTQQLGVSSSPSLPTSGKFYVQHAMGMDMPQYRYSGSERNLSPTSMVVVVCGRVELLTEVPAILRSLLCSHSDHQSCQELLTQRVFTNI